MPSRSAALLTGASGRGDVSCIFASTTHVVYYTFAAPRSIARLSLSPGLLGTGKRILK